MGGPMLVLVGDYHVFSRYKLLFLGLHLMPWYLLYILYRVGFWQYHAICSRSLQIKHPRASGLTFWSPHTTCSCSPLLILSFSFLFCYSFSRACQRLGIFRSDLASNTVSSGQNHTVSAGIPGDGDYSGIYLRLPVEFMGVMVGS